MTSRPRSVLRVGGVLAALLVAGAAIVSAPDAEAEFASIEVHGAVGELVRGRLLEATVSAVHIADELSADYAFEPIDSNTPGAWVVVDLTATWLLKSQTLDNSRLLIGERSFGASDILPPDSFAAFPANAGVPYSGSLAFEVPRDALESPEAGSATVLLRVTATAYPDSVPAIDVDLADVDRVDVLEVAEAAEVEQ